MNDLPKCDQKRHDCLMCDENGCCISLTNTKFFHKKCPFYKKRIDYPELMEEVGNDI